MLVKDIMSTRVEVVAPSTTIDECARKMEQLGIGVLAIRENGQALGLVTDRDICCRVVGASKDPAKNSSPRSYDEGRCYVLRGSGRLGSRPDDDN